MYCPRHFRLEDADESLDLADRRSAGTLVVATPGGFEASLLPWLVDRGDGPRLLGHCARGNPIAEFARNGPRALVIFDVADGYISPAWYPSVAEHGRAVPTWNYVTVHVQGRLRRRDDRSWLRNQIRALTDKHEREMESPWSVSKAPEAWIESLMDGIVGLEVEVERVEGKAKLGQNREAVDIEGVLAAIEARPGFERLAAETRTRASAGIR